MYEALPADFFLLRRPLLSINDYISVQDQLQAGHPLDSILRTVYSAPHCRHAIYYASPALHQQLEGWMSNKLSVSPDFLLTLYRYFVRMATRATPFGLFAGVMHGQWLANPPANDSTATHLRPVARLSTDYLCHLVATLTQLPHIRAQLVYRPNATLWQSGGAYRYVGYTEDDGQLTYYQQETPTHPVLTQLLEIARPGASIAQLAGVVTQLGSTQPEAEDYVTALIDNYLLVPTLGVPLTGNDPLDTLMADLTALNGCQEIVAKLQAVQQILASHQPDTYTQIDTLLQPLGLTSPVVVQCDLLFQGPQQALPLALNHQINKLLPLLTRLALPKEIPLLQAFRTRFYERFGDQQVPLLLALDPDSGIGYGHEQAIPAPWLTQPPWPSAEAPAMPPPTLPTQELYRLYATAMHRQEQVVSLSRAQLEALLPAPPAALPYHAYLMVSLVEQANGADPLVLLKAMAGPSAANLIGRFAHLDPQLTAGLVDLAQREQQAYPDAVLAELVHLPESKTGNLLRRPQLRPYEIPVLTTSTLPLANQFALSDLSISVTHGQHITLHARPLHLPVLPRLSTAHNVHAGSLVHYRFLHDLQHQTENIRVIWQWGPLAELPFLPRIQCGQLVLCRARWQLKPGDIDTDAHWEQWRQTYRLPHFVMLGEDDNELAINTLSPLGLAQLRHSMKQAGHLTLVEWLDATQFTHAPQWSRELLIPIQATRVTPVPNPAISTTPAVVARRFLPGSEWVYLKLYAGAAVLDTLLLDGNVTTLVDTLQRKQLIDGWFFVRYADPETHLRLRFRCFPAKIGAAVKLINQWAARQTEVDQRIYRVQFDTYERELERYGTVTMAACEAWFGHDSAGVLRLMTLANQSQSEWERLRMGCLAVYALLTAWQKTLPEQIALVEEWRELFLHEFNADKPLRDSLNDLFRQQKPQLTLPDSIHEIDLVQILDHYTRQAAAFRAQHQTLTDPSVTEALLPHLTHMLINRLFPDDQRRHELVVYYFLHKLLKQWHFSKPPQPGV
ncbi:lantibiotic dehydratase [Fibrella aquatilis]|uniref:Lantibiotic dehydratase n=1 Tax=Fibrella aquatilis TaxID=2817059 RepID=A0A939JXI0_9BACT|nr:lantibiotic dehydratase [Fibrella aquatilis]MBO0932977.1 lantibiotic dehydratase [Fibrella aquatilis]